MSPRPASSRSRMMLAPAVLLADALLLFGAVGVGLGIPRLKWGDPFPEQLLLSYSALASSVPSLSAGFIEQALGITLPGAPRAPEPAPAPAPPAGAPVAAGPDRCVSRCGPQGVTAPTNEHLSRPATVDGVPYTHRVAEAGGGRDPGEPAGCDPSAGGTLWWRYRATEDRGLIASTHGTELTERTSNPDSARLEGTLEKTRSVTLSVFSGPSPDGLQPVGCVTDSRGAAVLPFAAQAGTDYWFQISTPHRAGTLAFNLDLWPVARLESVSSAGEQGNNASSDPPSISADGRLLAFESAASNLVPGDTNLSRDIFVRDRLARTTHRVSVSSTGQQADGNSSFPSVSDDGRFVAFASNATNLAELGGTCLETREVDRVGASRDRRATCWQVYLHDRDADGDGVLDEPGGIRTTLISATPAGTAGNFWSSQPHLSPEGRTILFVSRATDLVTPDANGDLADALIWEASGGGLERLAVSTDGGQANQGISLANNDRNLSTDGRYVVFRSAATNLDPADTDTVKDLFVHDRHRARTRLITNRAGNYPAVGPTHSSWAISADGRSVAYVWRFPESYHEKTGTECTPPPDAYCTPVEVVVWDRDRGASRVVSVNDDGAWADLPTSQTTISADGRYVAFGSSSRNLGPQTYQTDCDPECAPSLRTCTNYCNGVYVRDLRTGTTRQVTAALNGYGANSPIHPAIISDDGRTIGFWTTASNLVRGDDNVCSEPTSGRWGGLQFDNIDNTGDGECPDVFSVRNLLFRR